jgi:hypothetical protein
MKRIFQILTIALALGALVQAVSEASGGKKSALPRKGVEGGGSPGP